jgi:hypothetical protein
MGEIVLPFFVRACGAEDITRNKGAAIQRDQQASAVFSVVTRLWQCALYPGTLFQHWRGAQGVYRAPGCEREETSFWLKRRDGFAEIAEAAPCDLRED